MSPENKTSYNSTNNFTNMQVVINSSGISSPVLEAGDADLFGKYEIGKLLGCGAFAKVYHARNIISGQSVAVKAVSKQKVLKGGFAAHVKREISIMHRMRHPHIVKLIEVLATKTKIYFVIEYAKGGELFTKVSKGRFSEDLSRKYFQQLMSAVGYCHSRGVFHRDLKPENLLLDENWNLKVSDFGLSAVNEQVRPDGFLHTLCGTPAYVAPEMIAKTGYDGAKVDVWTCGVILFVLSSGYLPFSDTNIMIMYRKIYKGEFRFPKWTSPDLRRLVSRLLDTNPKTRITIDEILMDPWFRKGYKDVKFHCEDLDLKDFGEEQRHSDKIMNAFDLISFSSGFNLSGLINESDISDCSERFVSAETPDTIIEKVEEIAKADNVKVMKKMKWGIRLEGYNGNYVAIVDVYRLTEKLVVVEVKRRERLKRDTGTRQKMWKDKLRSQLEYLVYQSEEPVSSHLRNAEAKDPASVLLYV